MRTIYSVLPIAGLIALGAWTASSVAHAHSPSVETGGDIAARWCADCHVISSTGEGVNLGPSFAELADQRSPNQLTASLSGNHAQPMKGFTLSTREVADLVAYIDSLKEQTAGK